MVFFTEIEQILLIFVWKQSKASSEVRTGWRHLMLWFQTMSWSCNHQNSAGLTSAQTRRPGHVIEPKLILLTAQQANKLGEKVLEQGIIILIGKLADQEDGRLATRSIFSQTQFIPKGRGWCPLQCWPVAVWHCSSTCPSPVTTVLLQMVISALQRMKPVYSHNILNALHRLWSWKLS